MSKIGKKPLYILEGVTVKKIDENNYEIKGEKGTMFFKLPENFNLQIENNILTISPKEINKKTKALWGTLKRILENKIIGVKKGFEKILILEGLGYTAELKDKKIIFKIGFSHPVELDIVDDINIEIKQEKGKAFIYVRGIDKEKVGNFASKIKKLKPADRYHLKGFRYVDEVIKTKPVKKIAK
jgi:large subunit ribosomal protein L6